jgi:hypothetical protein
MDPANISAFSGLVGAAIGGFGSFASSWLIQRAQLRDKDRERQVSRREALFNAIIEEVARLYGDALTHQKDDVSSMVKLYALVAELRLVSSAAVITAAEHVLKVIGEAYLSPNRTLKEIDALAADDKIDILREFAKAGRTELAQLQ